MELVIALRDHGLLRVGRGVRVWTGVPGEEVAKDFFFFWGSPWGDGGVARTDVCSNWCSNEDFFSVLLLQPPSHLFNHHGNQQSAAFLTSTVSLEGPWRWMRGGDRRRHLLIFFLSVYVLLRVWMEDTEKINITIFINQTGAAANNYVIINQIFFNLIWNKAR